ncbi:MAG: YggS family pyridoxal phosphate-dependent enzyme [Planifilum sp.]|jgi:pyridoxal phosphate enzyme (YggS family)
MEDLRHRWNRTRELIEAACRRSGRDPRDVRVVAVTKYVDADAIREVLDVGLTDIGESRVQEAVPKWKALDGRGTWHFIGHLQRNKVKDVVTRFTYIHSLDRYPLAEEINRRARQVDRIMRCFIQVNVSGEQSKFGLPPSEVVEFAREVAELPYIRIEGLMTMAPRSDNSEEIRPIFRRLREIRDEIRRLGDPKLQVPHLSMGMSQDYTVAVEEGATWLRLGSVLVGGSR